MYAEGGFALYVNFKQFSYKLFRRGWRHIEFEDSSSHEI